MKSIIHFFFVYFFNDLFSVIHTLATVRRVDECKRSDYLNVGMKKPLFIVVTFSCTLSRRSLFEKKETLSMRIQFYLLFFQLTHNQFHINRYLTELIGNNEKKMMIVCTLLLYCTDLSVIPILFLIVYYHLPRFIYANRCSTIFTS